MEERFEVLNRDIERIKKDIVSVTEAEHRILFAYLHGSFGNLPFRDIDIAAYCTILEDDAFDFERNDFQDRNPRLSVDLIDAIIGFNSQ
jgi:predicted nucleotidyltransferase